MEMFDITTANIGSILEIVQGLLISIGPYIWFIMGILIGFEVIRLVKKLLTPENETITDFSSWLSSEYNMDIDDIIDDPNKKLELFDEFLKTDKQLQERVSFDEFVEI